MRRLHPTWRPRSRAQPLLEARSAVTLHGRTMVRPLACLTCRHGLSGAHRENQAGSSASGAIGSSLAALCTNSSLPPRPQSHRTPCRACTGWDSTRERLLLHAVRSAASSIACRHTTSAGSVLEVIQFHLKSSTVSRTHMTSTSSDAIHETPFKMLSQAPRRVSVM